jgi:1-acyl-sn-glycerol-3-phosphate acyltransferase
MEKYNDVESLTQYITDEVFRLFKQSPESWVRRTFGPVIWLPAHRFADLAVTFDGYVGEYGLREAALRIISKYVSHFEARNVEHIPREGPLLITSNHPGTIDSLVITASIPRPDLKIVATGIPFIQSLRNAADHLIYTPRKGIHERMIVVRSAIRHLQDGGAVLIFPSGRIDPDPALSPKEAKEFGKWSHSVELMLEQVPQTQVLLTVISDVLSARWRWNPLVRLMGDDLKQRSVAEVLQVIQSIILPSINRVTPRLTFSDPLTTDELVRMDHPMLDAMIERARCLMEDHLANGENLLPAHTSM